MTLLTLRADRSAPALGAATYVAAVFVSAALVFMLEPLTGRLTLPLLGGGSGVWSASLAFFQIALLLGYLYAHLLQRVRSVRDQTVIHLGVLALASLSLPLHLSGVLGEPRSGSPVAWLLGELALSVGAPFAALSATAPLLQAWRTQDAEGGSAYRLYGASNLGSLLALAAYPLIIEPNLTLADQRRLWTLGYGVFFALAAAVALTTRRRGAAVARETAAPLAPAPAWRERGAWVFLAAVPSSLMMGATTHLSSDVGSVPLLWVVPLALYLLTFILAFRDGGERSGPVTLNLQVLAVAGCAATLPVAALGLGPLLALNLAAFGLSALVCHRALYALRPQAGRLTEFYLLVAFGGFVGGAFNAFVAPVVFDQVWEYPLALVLACLARPAPSSRAGVGERVGLAAGLAAAAVLIAMGVAGYAPTVGVALAAGVTAASVYLLRGRRIALTVLLAGWTIAAQALMSPPAGWRAERSFFGVHRVAVERSPQLGEIRKLTHGNTLHGAERVSGPDHCTPMTYYGPGTPISDAFALVHRSRPQARIGAVGLGAGSVAALTAPGDTLRFFEIDPAVLRIARDERVFDFVGPCARGRVEYALGDGRLLLQRAPAASFDLLLIDAFSSDSVPTHLLTTEALRTYLRTLKPDGVLLMHLTNRNLRLVEPAAAGVLAVGASERVRVFTAPEGRRPSVESSTVMAVAQSPDALRAFERAGWRAADPGDVRPWTDDYVNVVGALRERLRRGADRQPE